MSQIALLGSPVAPLPESVDLRCCGVAELLADWMDDQPDLVITDPPWPQYQNRPGVAAPDGRYAVMSEGAIADYNDRAAALLVEGGRFGMWTCWPLLVEAVRGPARPPWLDVDGVRWVTGGAWTKTDHMGVGYHWLGRSEPILVGVKRGAAAGRMACPIGNGWASKPGPHSAKPAGFLADMIRAWVPPYGLVLDLFAGTGATAVATVMAGEGRRYVGAELDPERHALACGAVNRAWQDALDAVRARAIAGGVSHG